MAVLTGNQVEKAFARQGVKPKKEQRKRKPKTFTCKKCDSAMDKREGENFMVCHNCGNYFIFDK